jgi:mannose-6-phosphate isomerase-like protein (cupin superfamily)
VDVDRWVVVDISEIAGAFVPDDEPGLSREQREQARRRLREQPPEQKARLEQASHEFPDFGQRWHAIRQNLGITAFGMNANEGDAGELLFLPHDEVEHGHEEVYVVIRGRARFDLGSDTVEALPGYMLYARAGVLRSATALDDGTLVLAVGGLPGSYSPPIWSADWRPPAL